MFVCVFVHRGSLACAAAVLPTCPRWFSGDESYCSEVELYVRMLGMALRQNAVSTLFGCDTTEPTYKQADST